MGQFSLPEREDVRGCNEVHGGSLAPERRPNLAFPQILHLWGHLHPLSLAQKALQPTIHAGLQLRVQVQGPSSLPNAPLLVLLGPVFRHADILGLGRYVLKNSMWRSVLWFGCGSWLFRLSAFRSSVSVDTSQSRHD